MRNSFLFILIFSVFNICISQNQYEFVGGIKLNDSLVIPYTVSFAENNGKISGYSVTDLGGEHETRSNIYGKYSLNDKALTFKETGIVYTKSPVSQQDFCFLNVTIKSFVFGKSEKIKSNFVGLFSDNTECINGELLLSSKEKVDERMKKMVKKINKSKKIADSIKQKLNLLKMMDTMKMNVLKKDETLSVFTKSNTIKLIIFDGGKEDGDKISILVNNKVVLSGYEAKADKKIISIPITKEKTSLVIQAVNEGEIAPNTVIVEIDDNDNLIKALSNLKKHEKTQIDILRTKK
ncbi:hypothetical protein [uncultured Algibacter sp.]|uniref:hypothetical protein n=1 Tax=uncultured Algibacter sp. TaxID=298659 RepID=UPI0032167017